MDTYKSYRIIYILINFYYIINQILLIQLSGVPYLSDDAAIIQWRMGHLLIF